MQQKIRDEKKRKRLVRRRRVAKNIANSDRPRVTVFRSSKHIYAQLDDPLSGKTLGTVSSRNRSVIPSGESTSSIEAAKKVGAAVAALALEKNIQEVVFNRNGFLYHGRVKALADAAREAGLQF